MGLQGQPGGNASPHHTRLLEEHSLVTYNSDIRVAVQYL